MKKAIRELKDAYRDMDKVLFFVTVLLFIFGLINILTASSREAVVNNGVSMTYFFRKQLIALVVGFVVTNIIFVVPTKGYYRFMIILYTVFLLLIGYLVIWGSEINGAKNWLVIQKLHISIQPSEMMKLILICSLAMLFEKYFRSLTDRYTPKNKLYQIYGYIIICIIFPMALIFLQKDLGTMFVIFLICGSLSTLFTFMFLIKIYSMIKID